MSKLNKGKLIISLLLFVASIAFNASGKNNQGFLDFSGKLYFFSISAHAKTQIFWKVNNSTWYSFEWNGGPSEAIQVLCSMAYIDSENVK